MANFDTLKATIAARIPDNIDQLITAEDVRQSFLDTIDEINAAKEDDGAVAPAVWGGISGDIADQTDLQTALGGKQATLVSGTNIKTINNESLLGSGNIVIQGGGGASVWGQITGDIDDQTDLKNALAAKQDTIADLATIESGAAAGATAVQPGDLATVATSGEYDDLLNKPTIPAAQVQADWNEADNTKADYIKNKPTIPAAQVNSDWNAASGVAQILNKPTIPAAPGTLDTTATTAQATSASEALSGAVKLHKVSKTGSYSDLIGTPSIPVVEALTNAEIDTIWAAA